MSNGRDTLFKIGLGVQLLLIPIAFLWRFSQEANYYYWIIGLSFAAVVALFFWPQAIQIRANRLAAIKKQLLWVAVLLVASWAAYLYFHQYVEAHDFGAIYSVNWPFGYRWVMLLGPGISPSTAVLMTLACIALPLANLYRYKLDKKRIKGIKKEDLFV